MIAATLPAKLSSTLASPNGIRSQFPALARVHQGERVAYFDGPGGTQVPRVVVEAMTDYIYHHNANTHWAFPSSAETDALIDEARNALANFVNADPTEIVFGSNMTTLTFHLARTLGRGYKPGDEIVVTELDHHANVAPWRALEKERGVRVRVAKMIAESGELDWEHFEQQLSGKTKMVAIGAASNALGTITDVRRAAELAHSVGAQIFIDAVAYAPHELTDVRQLDCDFLSCSAYKFYGPHLGVLFGRRDLLASLDFPKLIPAPNEAPSRAETGTQNHEGIAGAAAAVNFFASLASGSNRREKLRTTFAGLHERGSELIEQLWDGLSQSGRVKIYGPPPGNRRTPTVSFTVKGISSTMVSSALAERGIFASNGDFYATTLVERLGHSTDGLVRAGCACYTTSEEIARLVEAVQEIAAA